MEGRTGFGHKFVPSRSGLVLLLLLLLLLLLCFHPIVCQKSGIQARDPDSGNDAGQA
jgi:hypothetical protein